MAKVLAFTGTTKLDIEPDQILDGAKGELTDCLLVGYTHDGDDGGPICTKCLGMGYDMIRLGQVWKSWHQEVEVIAIDYENQRIRLMSPKRKWWTSIPYFLKHSRCLGMGGVEIVQPGRSVEAERRLIDPNSTEFVFKGFLVDDDRNIYAHVGEW